MTNKNGMNKATKNVDANGKFLSFEDIIKGQPPTVERITSEDNANIQTLPKEVKYGPSSLCIKQNIDMTKVEIRLHQYISKMLNVGEPVSLSLLKQNIMSLGDTCSRLRQEIANREQLLTDYRVKFAALKMFHDILDTKQEIG